MKCILDAVNTWLIVWLDQQFINKYLCDVLISI